MESLGKISVAITVILVIMVLAIAVIKTIFVDHKKVKFWELVVAIVVLAVPFIIVAGIATITNQSFFTVFLLLS